MDRGANSYNAIRRSAFSQLQVPVHHRQYCVAIDPKYYTREVRHARSKQAEESAEGDKPLDGARPLWCTLAMLVSQLVSMEDYVKMDERQMVMMTHLIYAEIASSPAIRKELTAKLGDALKVVKALEKQSRP